MNLHFSLIPSYYNPHTIKTLSPQEPYYSQFKEGLGKALEGVFRQLPDPVAGQIPKPSERQQGEKKTEKEENVIL